MENIKNMILQIGFLKGFQVPYVFLIERLDTKT